MIDDMPSMVDDQPAFLPSTILFEEAELVGLIRQLGALSRTDLVRQTEYSHAKITLIVRRLVNLGILHEISTGESQGSRRLRLLHFNSLNMVQALEYAFVVEQA